MSAYCLNSHSLMNSRRSWFVSGVVRPSCSESNTVTKWHQLLFCLCFYEVFARWVPSLSLFILNDLEAVPEPHCWAGSWRWWKSRTSCAPRSGSRSSSASTRPDPDRGWYRCGNTGSASSRLSGKAKTNRHRLHCTNQLWCKNNILMKVDDP